MYHIVPKVYTVQSQSKLDYPRHHVYPSYNHQYMTSQPIPPTDPYYNPTLLAYPPTPTDPNFSFDPYQ